MGLNILVTGGSGLIASAIKDQLGWGSGNHNISNPSKDMFDVTNFDFCYRMLQRYHPDLIIHAAGYTSMDNAEANEEECFNVNARGTESMAICCNHLDIPMFYFSTDAVFDGTKASPYTIYDKPNPLSVYGRSKLAGEEAIQRHLTKFWILRTTQVYGLGRQNYITDALAQLGEGRRQFRTNMSQVAAPTYVNDLVKVVQNLLDSKRYGIYHYTNEGSAYRWQVISEIDRLTIQFPNNEKELLFSDYPTKAKRPYNACLKDNTNSFNRPWQEALKEFIDGRN